MGDTATTHASGFPRALRHATTHNGDHLAKTILLGLIILLVSLSTNFILGVDQSKEYLAAGFERRLDILTGRATSDPHNPIELQVILAIGAMFLHMLVAGGTCHLFHSRLVHLAKTTKSNVWYVGTLGILLIASWPFYTFADSTLSAYESVYQGLGETGLNPQTTASLKVTLHYFLGAIIGSGAIALAVLAAHHIWPRPMVWVDGAASVAVVLIAAGFHVVAGYLETDWFRQVGAFALVFIGGGFVWTIVYTFWASRVPDPVLMGGYVVIAVLIGVKAWGLERTAFTTHTPSTLVKVDDCHDRAKEFLKFEREILSELLEGENKGNVLGALECGSASNPLETAAENNAGPNADYFAKQRFTRSLKESAGRRAIDLKESVTEKYERRSRDFFEIPPINDKITEWFAARSAEIEKLPPGEKYPVFVAAAEGGGMYAAYLTAMALARLQDERPRFADHLFAISAVSGGGVGAQLFADLAYRKLRMMDGSGGAYQFAVEQFFRTDFQAPLVGALLFADAPSFILPRWTSAADRATALSHSFDSGWDRMWDVLRNRVAAAEKVPTTGKRNYFADGAARGADAPAVIINATLSNNGMPVILSPFYFSNFYGALDRTDSWAFYRFAHFFDVLPGVDMPVTTGVLLGARFPYITPGGRFPIRLGSRRKLFQSSDISLADGGYFDNTGTATALALIRRIREAAPANLQDKIDVKLIRMVDPTSPGYSTVEKSPSEAILPLATLYATRSFTRDFYARLMESDSAPPYDVTFDPNGTPLSWQLSRATRKHVEDAVRKSLEVRGRGLFEVKALLQP